MAIVNDYITRSLRKLGVYQVGEDIPPQDFDHCLDELNAMLDGWAHEKLLGPVLTRVSKVLTIGDGEYTLGTVADIVTTRPIRIEHAFIRDGSEDYTLSQIGKGEYNSISNKTVSSMPCEFFFENSLSLAKIYLFPLPDKAYTLLVDAWYQFTRYAKDDTVSLPVGYEDLIVYNLMVRIAPDFGKVVSPQIQMLAEKTLNQIKNTNANDIPLVSSFPGRRGNYL